MKPTRGLLSILWPSAFMFVLAGCGALDGDAEGEASRLQEETMRRIHAVRNLAKYDSPVDLKRWLLRPSLELMLLFDRRDFGGSVVRDHAGGADSTVEGGSPGWANGPRGPLMFFTSSSPALYLQTPLTIDAWDAGTIAILSYPGYIGTIPILSDYSGAANGAVYLKHSWSGSMFTFEKHNGVAPDTVEATINFDTFDWHFVSCDWGPAGLRIFVNGTVQDTDVGVTDGTRNAPVGLRLNRFSTATYGVTSCCFLGVWKEQLCPAAHRAISRSVRRPVQ